MTDGDLIRYARASWPDGSSAEQDLLARQMTLIVAVDDALERAPPLSTPDDEFRTFLPWHPSQTSRIAQQRAPIRAAVRWLDDEIARCEPLQVQPPARSAAAGWWRLQAAALVSAAWQEALWRSEPPPDEASYLAVAQDSIGVGWLAATLVRLAGRPRAPAADARVLDAIRAVALAVRAANDLHDTARERGEGKVQLLFLRARGLEQAGLSPIEAERCARTQLGLELAQRVAYARALLDPSGWTDSGRLCAGLLGMLDSASELYGRTNGSSPSRVFDRVFDEVQ